MRNAHCEQPTGAMHTIAMEKGAIDRRRYLDSRRRGHVAAHEPPKNQRHTLININVLFSLWYDALGSSDQY